MNRALCLLGLLLVSTGCTGQSNSTIARDGDESAPQAQSHGMEDDSALPTTSQEAAGGFEDLARRWEQHCEEVAASADMNDRLQTPAYRELVALGRPAVPLIFARWADHDDVLVPWYFALEDITGLQMIEDRNHFSPREAVNAWREWWQRNRTSSRFSNHERHETHES